MTAESTSPPFPKNALLVTTIPNMFDSVVANNFDAVALLRYGRFDESAFLARKAVEAVQRSGKLALVDDQSSKCRVRVKVASVPIDILPSCAAGMDVAQNSSYPLFARGYVLEGALSLPVTDETASVCASVSLYNMAMGLHLKGLSLGVSSCLQKARGLYEKVYAILSSYSQSPSDSVCSIMLATVNNLIACECALRGHDDATVQHWKGVYGNLFGFATSSFERSVLLEFPEELTFFTSSAVFYANQRFSAAPAA